MIHIEPKDWYESTFAISKIGRDLLRYPTESYLNLPDIEKNKIRQTQIVTNEIFRILGKHSHFLLIMKYDLTLGWIEDDDIENSSTTINFVIPESPFRQPKEFLEHWQGVKYLLGGISEDGIDCSGFIQRYFFEVHGKIIPKNSRNQRKLGLIKNRQNIGNGDLAFCHRKGSDLHHVVLFFENNFWHARPRLGVVSQSSQEFEDQFEIECVASINL